MIINTYKPAYIIYIFFFLVITFPFWGENEVIGPHRQYSELAAIDTTGSIQIENRKFSDFTNGYIPEISAHLTGPRSGWLTLWTNQNELGRPTYQISGFSPAYVTSWVIAHFTKNPWLFITILSLSTCFLTGIFILLYCQEVGIHSLAGLIAGITIATSPLFMYWLTFPMFPAVWCWSAGILWSLTRLNKRPDLVGWGALSFSTYSILMTAYPQPVVFHAYLLTGYGLYLAFRSHHREIYSFGRFFTLVATALITGSVLALPVYIDLAHLSLESARTSPDAAFFTSVLPSFDNFTSMLRFFVLSTVPELFGNSVETSYPFTYDGLSVTLIAIFFTIVGIITNFRNNWGWCLAILILCLLTFIHPLYAFCVKYLGFNLSRSTPLGSIMLPLTIIIAQGVNELVKRFNPKVMLWTVWCATAVTIAVIISGVLFGLNQKISIDWRMLITMLIVVGLLSVQYKKTFPILLIAALLIILITSSFPLILHQAPLQIATTSNLVKKVQLNLPVGSRFAITKPGLSVLPPNLNASLGLASVHSYNSLSSKRYHDLIEKLGGEMQTYGRWNGSISPDYSSTLFWMSNISLILSPTRLRHKNLKYLGNESGVYLYKVISCMGESIQIPSSHTSISEQGFDVEDPRKASTHSPVKIIDKGDLLEFKTHKESSSVLILSQKYHRDWKATVLSEGNWSQAKTTVINGVFQGVILPKNTQKVRLEFMPYSRYAWIAHLFWLSLLTLSSLIAWNKKIEYIILKKRNHK